MSSSIPEIGIEPAVQKWINGCGSQSEYLQQQVNQFEMWAVDGVAVDFSQ
jgi:hypothetical protein